MALQGGAKTSTNKDPFNWPMPNRKDLMSLSSISKDKDLFRAKTAHVSQRQRSVSHNLATNDIQGAQPKQWVKETISRPEFLGQNWDIDRSCPRALHMGLNKPEYNLSNSDIEKSKPNYIKFQTTRPPSNPLNPQYKLPEVEYRPPTPPKFIRDQITNEDIDGAHPKKAKYYETRNIMDVKDIDGAKAKQVYVRSTQYDSFSYADITKDKFTSSRSVNPLLPQYQIRDESGQLITIGEIAGSSPKKQPERLNGGYFSGLEVKDIPGTAVGSKRLGNFHSKERKHFRDTNNIGEIEGAQASTIKRGVSSQRQTNPLNPTYKMPGHSEMGIQNPYGNKAEESSMASKYMGIRKQIEAKQESQKTKTLKQVVVSETDFKKDMAKFYGVNPGATKDVNLNHFVGQKGKENESQNDIKSQGSQIINRPQTVPVEGQYRGQQSNQASEKQSQRSVAGGDDQKEVSGFQIKERAQTGYQQIRGQFAAQQQNQTSTLFQRNAALFYGDQFDCGKSMSSQGSIFQKNAANFYGVEQPAQGERPFKIPKPSVEQVKQSKGFSVLNEQRTKVDELNMQRDPKFINNKDKFFGAQKQLPLKSGPRSTTSKASRISDAQRLDTFIQNPPI
ncbi:UNKNOWN [Stylonychia lemnae]|uniref:Uncharacterized protein n=1 Tax=Stylonychia lemnae TaxID=5949 RepID=A0A078A3R6_STYLE|nr:UNKNOWN [Stylonychia lemnae]|eukprot:CDW75394.1 UNKNOWN [Stylonychia lemnae]